MKKLLIALLGINALLIALLTAQTTQAAWTKSENSRVKVLEQRIEQLEQLAQKQSSQSAQVTTKSYDAVKLTIYSACLNKIDISLRGFDWAVTSCSYLKP